MQIEEKKRAKEQARQAQRQQDIDDEARMRQENETQYLKMINENSKMWTMQQNQLVMHQNQ